MAERINVNIEEKIADSQKNVVFSRIKPENISFRDGTYSIDFGKDAFGTLELTLDAKDPHIIQICLGEALTEDKTRIYEPSKRSPACNRRFRRLYLRVKSGRHTYKLKIPDPYFGDDYQQADYDCMADEAVKCPPQIGQIMPFRYCEVANYKGEIFPENINQLMAHYAFDDSLSRFHCSDDRLNLLWDFCKHTIKATSCFGLCIDGDRERRPYEGDTFVNQLSYYACDTHYEFIRNTIEWFCEKHVTWCYEWVMSVPLLAWHDCLYSGSTDLLERYYQLFDTMTLSELKRSDGLLVTGTDLKNHSLVEKLCPSEGYFRDVIDWPPIMRDNYELGKIGVVANCMHFNSLKAMANIARTLGKTEDCRKYESEVLRLKDAIYKKLFNPETGLFVDNEDSRHSSIHANFFPLYSGIVNDPDKPGIVRFLESKGMLCSPFGAQFLLEALYSANASTQALALMTSDGERSWLNMLRQGATMTMESWTNEIKANQDWNHPFSCAPANIICRRLMGIRPLAPGFDKARIAPNPGPLESAAIATPTVHGQIEVEFKQQDGEFLLNVGIPNGISADVHLPDGREGLELNGQIGGSKAIFRAVNAGKYSFVAKSCGSAKFGKSNFL